MKARLADAIAGIDVVEVVGSSDVILTNLTSDSRKVSDGSLFACMKGTRVDGAAFAEDAVRLGASAVLTDRPLGLSRPVTQVVVADVREALAHVAARCFGNPSGHLKVIGVTGTNGKTTTAHYVRSILEASGAKVGVMGTLGHWLGDAFEKDSFTTPEAPDVQRYMKQMLDGGAEFCVMEVSSHAIALRRVDHVAFSVVAFTNLTRDHLDFHPDFDAYGRTKMELFGLGDTDHFFGAARQAAINIGDPTGREIARLSPLPCLTFAVGQDADLRADITSLTWQGTRLEVAYRGRKRLIETPLRGRINATNALTAYAISLLLGTDEDAIVRGISGLGAVPGRMEYIGGPERQAIVDYAHTPDALRRLLAGVREIRAGKIICVFGCGGDRDRGKRPEMARIAAELADFVIVTSDNPRTEDPLKIIDDIVKGLPEGAAYEVVPDRLLAIRRAVVLSEAGDVIVVAGKGHEDYQIIGETKTHFDDREVLRKAFGAVANAKA
ncbi:MAG: UDP-N-acetylmuramoyl-L-alanyl-D-glutamate--2,6-diaminopimelate ligase [Candidatus Eisenbacteria bacterium]